MQANRAVCGPHGPFAGHAGHLQAISNAGSPFGQIPAIGGSSAALAGHQRLICGSFAAHFLLTFRLNRRLLGLFRREYLLTNLLIP